MKVGVQGLKLLLDPLELELQAVRSWVLGTTLQFSERTACTKRCQESSKLCAFFLIYDLWGMLGESRMLLPKASWFQKIQLLEETQVMVFPTTH